MSYIELHAASAFSFLQGASLPEALVDRAAELGYPAIALLDRDGVYGLPRFHKAALAAGIRPIVGAELTIAGAGRAGRAGEAGKETPQVRSVPPIPSIQPLWNRDEWDVALNDGAVYRIFQDRVTDAWFIDAIVD